MQCIITGNNQVQLTHCDETKKRAYGSQIVRAKEKPQVEPRLMGPAFVFKPDMQTVA